MCRLCASDTVMGYRLEGIVKSTKQWQPPPLNYAVVDIVFAFNSALFKQIRT